MQHDGLPCLPATTPVALVGATSAIGGGRGLLDPKFNGGGLRFPDLTLGGASAGVETFRPPRVQLNGSRKLILPYRATQGLIRLTQYVCYQVYPKYRPK